jgi:circadian clock protein KaiC
MCQNILVLRQTELRGRVRKVISVLKMRDSDFDSSVRELIVSRRGIHIGEAILDADGVLGGQPIRVPTINNNGKRGR